MTKVIGLTGTFCSGKGSAAQILKDKNYVIYVLSDIIRDELIKAHITITRKSLQDMGNALRKKHDSEVLALKTADKIQKDQSKLAVVDGIRNPAELKHLKKRFESCLIISVTASSDTRFKLLISRNKPSDPKNRAAFDELEARELGVGEKRHGQQVQKCLDMADLQIENEGTLNDLKKEVLSILNS